MDKPDSQMVGAGLAYILRMFLILPFFLLVIAMDVYGSESVLAWIEIGFHLLSCGLIALPRLANCLTFRWINEMELTLYLTQLPLHFIACYSYQKTESIWAPIVIHSVVNLLGCIAMLLLIT